MSNYAATSENWRTKTADNNIIIRNPPKAFVNNLRLGSPDPRNDMLRC